MSLGRAPSGRRVPLIPAARPVLVMSDGALPRGAHGSLSHRRPTLAGRGRTGDIGPIVGIRVTTCQVSRNFASFSAPPRAGVHVPSWGVKSRTLTNGFPVSAARRTFVNITVARPR